MTTRKAYIVYVNLDPMPGEMYTEESALQILQEIFFDTIPQYDPGVHYAPESIEVGIAKNTNAPERKAFLMYINLDDLPGQMYSQESAQNALRAILNGRMAHYNPLVSLAPAHLQVYDLEGTNLA
jgi:hypothetical protein